MQEWHQVQPTIGLRHPPFPGGEAAPLSPAGDADRRSLQFLDLFNIRPLVTTKDALMQAKLRSALGAGRNYLLIPISSERGMD